jgi:hypothetical protein
MSGAVQINSVRQSLIRQGIRVRGCREAQIYGRIDDGFLINHDVVEGSLLGDASLATYGKRTKLSMPYFNQTSKDYEYMVWLSSLLGLDTARNIFFNWNNKYKKYYYNLRSLSHDSLRIYLDRWYPESSSYPTKKPFEKIIPNDVCVSPLSLLNAFLGDGTHYRRRHESKKLQICISLCLEGFTPENLEVFRDKANRFFNTDMFRMLKYKYGGYGYRIFIRQSKAQDFYAIIGPPPVKCLAYKWKYAHNYSEMAK